MKKVSNEKPPQWILDAVKEFSDADWRDNIVFTYAPNIHTPSGKVSEDLYIHEMTHIKQQGDDPEGWWKKYLEDKEFRFSQELEAYANQWNHIKLHYSRNKMLLLLNHMAESLAGPMYGNLITAEKAKELIMNY